MNKLYSKFMGCDGDILRQADIGMLGILRLPFTLLNARHPCCVDDQFWFQCLKLMGQTMRGFKVKRYGPCAFQIRLAVMRPKNDIKLVAHTAGPI